MVGDEGYDKSIEEIIMKNILKWLSLSSQGLRCKLRIGFYLMSVLPIVIFLCVISIYMLPDIDIKVNIGLLVGVGIFIAISGFFVVRQIVDPILKISSRAKTIASGNIDYNIKTHRDDEIGDLEDALNELTLRIKGNMKELEKYGEETEKINLDINRKVVALSGLLQISSFISEGASLEETFNLTLEKMSQIADSDLSFLLLQEGPNLVVKSVYGEGAQHLLNKKMGLKDESLFSKIMKNMHSFSLNNNTPRNVAMDRFCHEFGVKNAFIMPVRVRDKVIGLAGIANSRGIDYRSDDFRVMDIFVKHIVIAIENDTLTHRVSNLEIKDALTGLYNEVFIVSRLDEEIKRAIIYQRPCSFILFRVNNYKEFSGNFNTLIVESTLKKIAVTLRGSISDIDKAARFSEADFAVIMPEKNKRQAQTIAAEIVKKIEYLFQEESDPGKRIVMIAGVSENPIDGVTSSELISKAKES